MTGEILTALRTLLVREGDAGRGALVPFMWHRPRPWHERERRLAERWGRPIALICGGPPYGGDPGENREPPRVSWRGASSFPWYEDPESPQGDGRD